MSSFFLKKKNQLKMMGKFKDRLVIIIISSISRQTGHNVFNFFKLEKNDDIFCYFFKLFFKPYIFSLK